MNSAIIDGQKCKVICEPIHERDMFMVELNGDVRIIERRPLCSECNSNCCWHTGWSEERGSFLREREYGVDYPEQADENELADFPLIVRRAA